MEANRDSLPSDSLKGLSVQVALDRLSNNWSFLNFFDQKPGVLTGARFSLSDSIMVEVRVKHFSKVKPYNPNRNWSLADFLEEKVDSVSYTPRHRIAPR
jgi:hypothetical protein